MKQIVSDTICRFDKKNYILKEINGTRFDKTYVHKKSINNQKMIDEVAEDFKKTKKIINVIDKKIIEIENNENIEIEDIVVVVNVEHRVFENIYIIVNVKNEVF